MAEILLFHHAQGQTEGFLSFADELRIEPDNTVSWSGQPRYSRGIPSGVRALTSGCYAAQMDGTTFSSVVVFLMDLAP